MPDSYSMVSVPKQGSNPGMPRGKKNIVILFDFDKVKTYTRDDKSVKITAFEMMQTAKPIGIFVDQKSIDCGDETEGDAYARATSTTQAQNWRLPSSRPTTSMATSVPSSSPATPQIPM